MIERCQHQSWWGSYSLTKGGWGITLFPLCDNFNVLKLSWRESSQMHIFITLQTAVNLTSPENKHLWTEKFLIRTTHTASTLPEWRAHSLPLRRVAKASHQSVCFWPFTSLCTWTKYSDISDPPSTSPLWRPWTPVPAEKVLKHKLKNVASPYIKIKREELERWLRKEASCSCRGL